MRLKERSLHFSLDIENRAVQSSRMRESPLALRDPDNVQWAISWAYATRRTVSIDAARLVLLEAVERIPNAAILHYNLACYECQLGDLAVAKARLQHAISLDPACRAMALDDQDLAPLWE